MPTLITGVRIFVYISNLHLLVVKKYTQKGIIAL